MHRGLDPFDCPAARDVMNTRFGVSTSPSPELPRRAQQPCCMNRTAGLTCPMPANSMLQRGRGPEFMLRIGVDIGGTFTDFAVWRDEGDGYVAIDSYKRPSSRPDFAEAV